MVSLKDIGIGVGKGTNAVISADLTAPVTGVRNKVRKVRATRQAVKVMADQAATVAKAMQDNPDLINLLAAFSAPEGALPMEVKAS